MKPFVFLLSIILTGFLFATVTSTTVLDVGNGKSNAALIPNADALIINPAFLTNIGFHYSKQLLDTEHSRYTRYHLEYFTFGSTGYGTLHQINASDGSEAIIHMTGFGVPVNRTIKWGMCLENIDVIKTSRYTAWSTKFGLSMILNQPAPSYWGFTMEHVFKEQGISDEMELDPVFALSYGFIPAPKLLWTHQVSYIRKSGESLRYATGVTLLVDRNLVMTAGINRDGYSAGIELPLQYGNLPNLGKLTYAIVVPYDLNQNISFHMAYSFGR